MFTKGKKITRHFSHTHRTDTHCVYRHTHTHSLTGIQAQDRKKKGGQERESLFKSA